jgi:hypothetical protein
VGGGVGGSLGVVWGAGPGFSGGRAPPTQGLCYL